jgi:uncharacterized protein (TIGR02147 family)
MAISTQPNVPDYVATLVQEFSNRSQNNSRYSLRAFARDLTLDPAQLSRILRRKKNLSPLMAQVVAGHLYPNQRSLQKTFVKLVEFHTAKRDSIKEKIALSLGKMEVPHRLELDSFRLINDWFRLAVLEFCELPGKTLKPSEIAERLGIHRIQVEESFHILQKLKLIHLDSKLGFRKTQKRFQTPTEVPSLAIRNFHKQMIQKAQTALETQDITERSITSRTFTVSKSSIPKIKELIEKFYNDLFELNSEYANHNSIYQLNVQLFNLEKKMEKK